MAALVRLQKSLQSEMHEAARKWNETNNSDYYRLALAYQNALGPLLRLIEAFKSIKAEETRARNSDSATPVA